MKHKKRSDGVFLLVLLIIFLIMKIKVSYAVQPFKKYHVKIVNQLSNGKPLDVHCKSGDKDLGLQKVPVPGNLYEFGFHINYFGTTLCFCNLWYWEFHIVFDAFRAEGKFIGQCGGTCSIWEARDNGSYLYNTEKKRENFKYKWGKQKKV